MDRLFIFGDSWANNYLSHSTLPYPFLHNKDVKKYAIGVNYWGHWSDHLSYFYNVNSYGVGGASFEQIIYQLGNLPIFRTGDRIVIILGVPERFTWYKSHLVSNVNFKNLNMVFNRFPKNNQVRKMLIDQLLQRNWVWENDQSLNERKFLNSLPTFFSRYSPIILSWSKQTVSYLNNVEYIGNNENENNYTTIDQESNGMCKDGHLGVKGNYFLFKEVSKLLNIDISDYSPELPSFKLPLT